MNNVATSISNLVSYICLTVLISENELLEWIYTIAFAVSVVFSVAYPIARAVRDKKITKKEYDQIQKSLEDAQTKIKQFEDKEKKEGK